MKKRIYVLSLVCLTFFISSFNVKEEERPEYVGAIDSTREELLVEELKAKQKEMEKNYLEEQEKKRLAKEEFERLKKEEEKKELVRIEKAKKEHIKEVRTTAYCLCKKCTGKTPRDKGWGVSRGGTNLTRNPYIVAGNPKVYPLGTIVYIEGLGYRIVGDTGSYLKTEKGRHTIDVYIGEPFGHDKALKYGVQNKKVIVIKKNGKWTGNSVEELLGVEEANSKHAQDSGRFLKVPLCKKKVKEKEVFITE